MIHEHTEQIINEIRERTADVLEQFVGKRLDPLEAIRWALKLQAGPDAVVDLTKRVDEVVGSEFAITPKGADPVTVGITEFDANTGDATVAVHTDHFGAVTIGKISTT